jgi:outer membrane protein
MKNITDILVGILTVAVVVLYILHFTSKPQEEVQVKTERVIVNGKPQDKVVNATTEIAYVNVDSLLTKYAYAKDLNEQLLKKEKTARAQLAAKENQLRTDYTNVQARYQKGLLSRDEAEMEGQKLNRQQKDLQDLNAKLTKSLMDDEKSLNKKLQDKVQAFFKEYNKTKHYKAIFSNSGNDNIFYAEEYLNITNDVISKLNEDYKKK